MKEKIAVIGLGYVGLPVALAFAKKFPNTVGFDVKVSRVTELKRGIDITDDVDSSELENSPILFTTNPDDLKGTTFFVVAVPTPVDELNNPDFKALVASSTTVGQNIEKGAVVVFESTVYPGVTEDICGPVIEKVSGLKRGVDFKLGYSPERINPGDREHTLERIVKVVSGEDSATLERVASTYAAIIDAGVHRAPSIKVAEAAKVIENTQRDLNIALMNELSLIFDRMGIATRDVLEAAGTKWNFLKFSPGLVGGHCIGVDPYYLTTKAEQLGYHPEVILSGRRINDNMGIFIAQRLIKLMVTQGHKIKDAKVGVFGLTFKENVSDIRNSRVPGIISELKDFGVEPIVTDPLAQPEEAMHEYGIDLTPFEELPMLDACIVAVNHEQYLKMGLETLTSKVQKNGVFIDVKSVFSRDALRSDLVYWSL